MNNVVFLTMMIPDAMKEEVAQKSSHNMQDAADALEKHIYEGLCANFGFEPHIVNVLPIDSFPQYYKDALIKRTDFALGQRSDHVNLGFCNVKLIRNSLIEQSVYKNLVEYFKRLPTKEKRVIIVYSATASFLRAVKRVKEIYPDIIVCDIIADLPAMTNLSSNKSALLKAYIEHSARQSQDAINCVDCFVLLTKQMADYLKIDKPFCVMEGISSPESKGTRYQLLDKKIILYTGTLHKKFGIMNLVEAFQQIKDSDYELVICGVGDSEDAIKAVAQKDKRIRFLGKLPREQVLEWQGKATVLVNPRQNNEEFTKYSFPSKTMEYLSSGVPLVAYKLDGIPDEYDPYIFYVNENSISCLANTVRRVCEMTEAERETVGKAGREFVLNQKNSTEQVKKIINLLQKI